MQYMTNRFLLIVFAVLLCAETAAASVAQIKGVRMWASPESTRLVIDLSHAVEHRLSRLSNPERVVIDVNQAKLPGPIANLDYKKGAISDIRSANKKQNKVRLVLDLKHKVHPKSFLLKPNSKYGYRLVIDLEKVSNKTHSRTLKIIKSVNSSKKRDLIVAIDAGHGGRDPGATGRSGTHEKIITLQIAKRLEKDINAQRGMKAVLIRKNDRYLRLRDRIHKARDAHADMMISLHADSFPDPRARGSSIYALSVDGASSETARMLAEKENAADLLFGDFNLAVEDQMVKEVLFDLSLTGTIESSLDIGSEIIGQIKSVNRVHKKKVQQAGFAVLKAPNIPSVLLETAFISNPREEKNLRSSAHQKKVSKAITRGVNKYFARKAPPGTWLASAECDHAVCENENIAAVAQKYNVNETDLRARNGLYADNLLAGQVIKIPVS